VKNNHDHTHIYATKTLHTHIFLQSLQLFLPNLLLCQYSDYVILDTITDLFTYLFTDLPICLHRNQLT